MQTSSKSKGFDGTIKAYMCQGRSADASVGEQILKKARDAGVCATLYGLEQDLVGMHRPESALNEDALRTVVESFLKKAPIPKVRYVLINADDRQKRAVQASKILQIQCTKHGWDVRHVNDTGDTESLKRQIAEVFENTTQTKGEPIMKKNETKEIFNTLNTTADKELSLRENMINYCVNAEHYSREDAALIVDDLIKGTSEFMNTFEQIKGRSKEEAIAGIKTRLSEKLKDLSPEDVKKILENIYMELRALGCDRLKALAAEVADDNLKAEIEHIREECKGTLADKTVDEQLELILEAAENCGSMSALLALSEDKRSFSNGETLDDAVVVATLNSTEEAYVEEEYDSFRNRSYAALAEYISAQHGNNRRFEATTPAYEVGVATAATVEQRRIRLAAIRGVISRENALKLLAGIAMVGTALALGYCASCLSMGGGLPLLFFHTPVWTAILSVLGILMFGYLVVIILKQRKKIKNALADTEGMKNRFIELYKKFCKLFGIKCSTLEQTVSVQTHAPAQVGEDMPVEEETVPATPVTEPVCQME